MKQTIAICVTVVLSLAILATLFIGLAIDHKSTAQLCAEEGGSYSALLKSCTMPGAPVTIQGGQ